MVYVQTLLSAGAHNTPPPKWAEHTILPPTRKNQADWQVGQPHSGRPLSLRLARACSVTVDPAALLGREGLSHEHKTCMDEAGDHP